MNSEKYVQHWLEEENIAHIHGWDFSHIEGKYDEERDLPWNYREIVKTHLTPESRILDIDTGGGEFLLSLDHPHCKTSATEAYPPNVQLCKESLLPLGIDFREGNGGSLLPFAGESFHVVINRHGDFNAEEICRVLKPGGLFITEQIGAENDRELVEMLFPSPPPLPFPEQYLDIAVSKFEKCGFAILNAQETFRPIRFWDVGALVWFSHIIEWEFPGFSVQGNLKQLLRLQEHLENVGLIEGRIHRFLLVAQKE